MRVTVELCPELLEVGEDPTRGWRDLCQGRKAHYICGCDGDWMVTICGLLIPERDTMAGDHENAECHNCTRAIEKVERLTVQGAA